MKPRLLLILLSVGLLITTMAMVGKQRQQLGDLHQQAQALQTRIAGLTNAPEEKVETSQPPATVQAGPSLELLRLRNQVGQLERRKRELAGLTAENQKLQVQLAAKATNSPGGGVALPSGYIRRANAKNVGFGSPEDALQSFLWAIEHRDLPTLLQVFEPSQAEQIAAELKRSGSSEDFFKDAGVVPGLLITERQSKEDGSVDLTVRIDPTDDSTQRMRFKQFDGQWRMVSGF